MRALREQRGWTLEYLEEVSGVPVGTISALEVRNSKRSVYASALAKAFGVTLEELLEDERLLELPKTPRAPEPAWPFKRLPIARVRKLSENQLLAIEDSMIRQVDAFLEPESPEDSSKKSEPRKRDEVA